MRFTVLLALLLASCAPAGGASGVSRPSAPAARAGAVTYLGAPGERLPPGRYTRADFLPTVSFEVGDGWTAEQVAAGFFDIQREVGSPDVIAVQFANVVGHETAAAVVGALRDNPYLRVDGGEPVEVGRYRGFRVVVQTKDPVASVPPVFREVVSVPAGSIGIASARRLQLTLLDTPRGVLGILVGGSIVQWDRTLEAALPVVESVRIGD